MENKVENLKSAYQNCEFNKELAERIFLKDLSECEKFPKYFTIGTTNVCNARCTMCPYSRDTVEGKMMEDRLFDKIISEMSLYSDWIESVNVYWYGEPILDKKIAERISKLKKIGIKNIQLSTNAACLFEENAEAILEAGVTDLRFSIDAYKKETYENIRRGLNYDIVVENVLKAIQIRDQKYPNIPIRIRIVELEENVNEMEDFIAYWRKHLSDIDKIQVMPAHMQENWKTKMRDTARNNLPDYPCIAVFSTMIIDVDGVVPLCCLDISRKVVLGNINENTIKEVWNNEKAKEIRMEHLITGRKAMDICENCDCWDREFKMY